MASTADSFKADNRVFILPQSFDPHEFLRTPKLQRRGDDARYFMATILRKTASGNVDEFGNVRLMARHLRNIMHFRAYNSVVDSLLIGGAVERASYHVGNCPFGYRLAERFVNDRHIRIAATDPRLIGRLKAFHQEAEEKRLSRMTPVHFALERHQQRLEIDSDLAREILQGLSPESNPHDVQGIQVADIADKAFHINVGRYGRVSNNVTSMKRELRHALRLGKEHLQHVDISCCQPALLGKTALERTRQQGRGQTGTAGGSNYDVQFASSLYSSFGTDGADLDVFCGLTQCGGFYEFLMEKLKSRPCSTLTRDDVKKRFLSDVIAKKKASSDGAEYPSDVEDTFRELFPSVHRFIRDINADGWEHENLIRELQRQESSLVIHEVVGDLVKRHPEVFVLTLHDAIFTTSLNIPTVLEAFERAFVRTGYPMSLKVA